MDDTVIDKSKKKEGKTLPIGKIQILFSVITEGKVWEQQSDGSQKQVVASTESFFIGGHVKKPIKVFERVFKRTTGMFYTKNTQEITVADMLSVDFPDNKTGGMSTGTIGFSSNLDPCFGFISNRGNQKWICTLKYSNIDQLVREGLQQSFSTDWILSFISSDISSESKTRQKEYLKTMYQYSECSSVVYLGSGFFLKSPTIDSIKYYIKQMNAYPKHYPRGTPRKDINQISPVRYSYVGSAYDIDTGQNDNYSMTISDAFISFTEKEFEILGLIEYTYIGSFSITRNQANSGGTSGNIYGWQGFQYYAVWSRNDAESKPPSIVGDAGAYNGQSISDGYLIPNFDFSRLKKTDAYSIPSMGGDYFLYIPVTYIFPESKWALPTFFGGINTSQSAIKSESREQTVGEFWKQPYSVIKNNITTDYGRKLTTKGGSSAAGELIDKMLPVYGPLDGSLSFGVDSTDPPGTQPHYLLAKGMEFIPRGVSNDGVISDEPAYTESQSYNSTEIASLLYYGGEAEDKKTVTNIEGTVMIYTVETQSVKNHVVQSKFSRKRVFITSNKEKDKNAEFIIGSFNDNVLLKELKPSFTQSGLDFYNVEELPVIGSTSPIWTKDSEYNVAKYEYKNGQYIKTIDKYKAFSFGYNDKNKPAICMIHGYSFHPN
ncbi:MAG: hypothetical protein ACRCT1_15490 [Microcoleaceae cyanobacterium]